MKRLTPREIAFVHAYLSTKGNGTESARRAGYKGNDNVLRVQASRLLTRARVQDALTARTERALKAIGGPTPEEVMQTLANQMRGGRFFRVDPTTGEPIVDLRELEQAGKLGLVKRITRRTTKRTLWGGPEHKTPEGEEETKDVGVELYSSQAAAEVLGRFLGMDKSRPEQPSALIDARMFVVAILESGDKQARAALDALARIAYPGPQPLLPAGRK